MKAVVKFDVLERLATLREYVGKCGIGAYQSDAIVSTLAGIERRIVTDHMVSLECPHGFWSRLRWLLFG